MVRSTIRACQGEKPPDAAAATVFLLGCRLSRTSEDIDPTDDVESVAGACDDGTSSVRPLDLVLHEYALTLFTLLD
jgi:hypothetical protein